jgi:transcriptional regulator with XRE-family HTH domain
MSAALARDIRRESGNTRQELADAYGVSPSKETQYESGYADLPHGKTLGLAPAGLRFVGRFYLALADVRENDNSDAALQLALPGVL